MPTSRPSPSPSPSPSPGVPRTPPSPGPSRPRRPRGPAAPRVLGGLALLAGLTPLLCAAPAGAATLRLSVQGTQTTTWRYVKEQAPTCDWPETEEGEQRIAFATKGSAPARVRVTLGAGGALRFSGAGAEVPAHATLKRSYDRRFAQITPCPDGGTSGGQGAPQNAAGTTACTMDGAVRMRLGTTREELYDAGDPALEAAGKPVRRGTALLRGEPVWPSTASPATLPAACSARDQGDADIGITTGRGEWAGGVIESRAPLALRRLLKPRRREQPKAAKVRVKTVVVYPNDTQPDPGASRTTGRTVLDLTLTFRR